MEKIKNKNIKPWHTFSTPTIADQVYKIESKSDLAKISNFDLEDFYILGGGSNILPVKKIKQPILKNELKGIEKIKETEDYVLLKIKSGENWHQFVTSAVEQNFSGVENLALIPGTVGGAIIQNAGAYGAEIKDIIESVEVFNLEKNKACQLDKQDCEFSYRYSTFKKEKNKNLFITSAIFKLNKNFKPNLAYNSLEEKIKQKNLDNIEIENIFNAVCEIRKNKLPDWKKTPTAGSFFKNPFVNTQKLEKLQQDFSDIPHFSSQQGIKIPAGWLIEKIEPKLNSPQGVKTYENHSLVIINPGEKSGDKVKELANQIKQKVMQTFGIKLNTEVKIW
jgi:UDP-N-acetylmuramate dehydrogenase